MNILVDPGGVVRYVSKNADNVVEEEYLNSQRNYNIQNAVNYL